MVHRGGLNVCVCVSHACARTRPSGEKRDHPPRGQAFLTNWSTVDKPLAMGIPRRPAPKYLLGQRDGILKRSIKDKFDLRPSGLTVWV